MKTYTFKFSKTVLTLSIIGLVLCIAAFIWNLINIFVLGAKDFNDVLQYSILFIATVLLSAIIVSLLAKSYYGITDTKLIISYGFLKNEIKLDTISSITHDKKTNKVSVYYEKDKYINIVVREEWYEAFITDLLDSNPKIIYECTPNDDKKDD